MTSSDLLNVCVCVCGLVVMGDEMAEDLTDDGEFSHLALCVCNAAENISASEDEWAHIQVNISTKCSTFCYCICTLWCVM